MYRRCLVLALVGRTPTETPSLVRIVSDGYLNFVKLWLDDVLATPQGMTRLFPIGQFNAPLLLTLLFYSSSYII